MKFIILFFFIIIGIYIYITNYLDSAKNKEKLNAKDQHINSTHKFSFICHGGLKDMGFCKSCFIELFKDRIIIKLYKEDNIGSIIGSKSLEVMLTNIIDLSLQTEKEIKEKVSLGKILVFGFLSLAMDKKSYTINKEFLVLTFNNNDEKVNLILESKYNDLDTFKLLTEINEYKKQIKTSSNEVIHTNLQN